MSSLSEKWSNPALCRLSPSSYPEMCPAVISFLISRTDCNPLYFWFFVLSPRFLLIQKVFMENGCSQRSVPSFQDDTCCRTLLWKSSWPTEVRRNSIVTALIETCRIFYIFGSICTDNLTFICDSPQWQSCLTSQMQPQSRRWSTVFQELGWERILVFHRRGETRLWLKT